MPLIITNDYSPFINNSKAADGLEVEQVNFYYANTPPSLDCEEIQPVINEWVGSRELVGTINSHGVPAAHSGQGLDPGDSGELEILDGEYVLNRETWDFALEADTDTWIESLQNNAVGTVADIAGNISQQCKRWDVTLVGSGTSQLLHTPVGNHNRYWAFGSVHDIHAMKSSETGLGAWYGGFPTHSMGVGNDDSGVLHGFSTNAVMLKALSVMGYQYSTAIEAAIDGWWSYEGMFNHQGYGIKFMMERFIASDASITQNEYYLIDALNRMHGWGFRVINGPLIPFQPTS